MAETVDATPVYMRIRRCIEERIERGAYPTGSMIPSEKDLAEEFGTTRLNIRSAVDELVRRGQIRRVRGKGAFVAQKVPAFFLNARSVSVNRSVLRAASRPSVFSRVPSVMRGHITPTCLASPRTTCSIPFDA